jgi:hypothetical protein
MKVLYAADNILISLDPDTRIMFCRWIGHQSKAGVQESGAIMLQLLKDNKIQKILNDNTEVSGPWIDASQWTAGEWFPEIIGAGLKHFAWVLSRNIFAEISAKKAMPDSEVVRSFYSSAEAYKWLLRIDELAMHKGVEYEYKI